MMVMMRMVMMVMMKMVMMVMMTMMMMMMAMTHSILSKAKECPIVKLCPRFILNIADTLVHSNSLLIIFGSNL